MIAALALSAAISAAQPHWIEWTKNSVPFGQIGVASGQGADEHLLLMVGSDGCSNGMRIYDGRYGEATKAIAMVEHSKLCDQVELRSSWFNSVYSVQQLIGTLPYYMPTP